MSVTLIVLPVALLIARLGPLAEPLGIPMGVVAISFASALSK